LPAQIANRRPGKRYAEKLPFARDQLALDGAFACIDEQLICRNDHHEKTAQD
jgi:hypothetical protein